MSLKKVALGVADISHIHRRDEVIGFTKCRFSLRDFGYGGAYSEYILRMNQLLIKILSYDQPFVIYSSYLEKIKDSKYQVKDNMITI